MSKYRSYGITLSTVEPVEGKGKEAFTNWLKKQDYYHGIIEGGEGKEQKLHAHAQVWYKEPREKGSLSKALKDIVKRHFPETLNDEGKVPPCAVVIRIAYNDWYETYLEKDVTELLCNKIPAHYDGYELREKYYPSQEEQEKVQKKARCADHRMNHLEELFFQWVGEEPEPDNEILKKAQVSRFLSDMMYKSRKIKVPSDMKIQRNLCSVFTNYLWQTTNSFILLSQEEQKLLEQVLNNQEKDI